MKHFEIMLVTNWWTREENKHRLHSKKGNWENNFFIFMYGWCLWVDISVSWHHSSIDNAIFCFFMCYVPCLILAKDNMHLIWISLLGSNIFKSSLCSSSKIMLWNNMLAMKMSKMISWSHNQDGFAMMWKWTCITPKTCFRSFLQDSCVPTKCDIFSPWGLLNGLHKNGPMWIYSINKEII